MRTGFTYTEKEQKRIAEFEAHECPFKYKAGAIGGRFTYSFTPTTLGVVIKVDCACGQNIDATDYNEW